MKVFIILVVTLSRLRRRSEPGLAISEVAGIGGQERLALYTASHNMILYRSPSPIRFGSRADIIDRSVSSAKSRAV